MGEPVEEDVDLGGGVKLTMMLIPPGEFVMGSTEEEQARFLEEAKTNDDEWAIKRIPSEGPEHRVRITRPFRLSRHEVTPGQFRQFVGVTVYKTNAEQNVQGAYPSETQVKRGIQIVDGDKRLEKKLGRNDPCPCGSGKRFKKCCLKSGCF